LRTSSSDFVLGRHRKPARRALDAQVVDRITRLTATAERMSFAGSFAGSVAPLRARPRTQPSPNAAA